ncbi:MAG: hypothetical protein HUK09_03430 [Bacteroidaceae bacterium]|nr:hypothetical protein [Bacteroidaceae bacterium]
MFDNFVYAYKYTPAPDFCIEYIDNISDLVTQNLVHPTPAILKKLTKHKIWKEGNVLKYQSWK